MKTEIKKTIPLSLGYVAPTDGGTIHKAITVVHTCEDEGKTFTDNFGRNYIYTSNGCIY